MAERHGRGVLWTLSVLLVAAQVVDMVWPRADARAASPASVVFAVCLVFLLGLYPSGRFVPAWTAVVAGLAATMFAAAAVVGPDVAERMLWPLPIAPLLLALIIGGQGYRYVRRSSAAEREAVRWPLLGLLLLVSITVPADLISVALTGATIGAGSGLGAVMQLAFLLPAIGFIVGLLPQRTDLVDRLLALWVSVVVAAGILGALFAGAFAVSGLVAPAPWPAWTGAAVIAVASIWVLPLAGRAGRTVVFRRRASPQKAVEALTRRITGTLDAGELPAEVAAAVRAATGARRVVLRRSGHVGVWATAGDAGLDGGSSDTGSTPVESVIAHLGLPVAMLEVWPRPAESALSAADRAIIEAMGDAAAPALHSARLASAFPELTERERQVLAGIVRGLPNSAIAARLGVSVKTVANYVSIVLTKLRVPDKERAAELARRRAVELG